MSADQERKEVSQIRQSLSEPVRNGNLPPKDIGSAVPEGWPPERVDRLRQLREAGYTYEQAGEALGVSRSRAFAIAQKYNAAGDPDRVGWSPNTIPYAGKE